eukprot:GHRQ01033385.1.p2 GENE.GHRQ01033385.1~~GHRQ01033385.1.p2  ORF type:complete len:101 (-),score=16.45 GHRQ01033385.1:402-704(-)
MPLDKHTATPPALLHQVARVYLNLLALTTEHCMPHNAATSPPTGRSATTSHLPSPTALAAAAASPAASPAVQQHTCLLAPVPPPPRPRSTGSAASVALVV